MTSALATDVAAVLWIIGGLGLFGGLAYGSVREADAEASAYLASAGIALAATGSVVLGLAVLGLPEVAQWAWRVMGAASVVMAVIFAVRADSGRFARTTAALNVLVTLTIGATSFLAGAGLLRRGSPGPAAAPVAVTIDGVALWHALALAILALGTVVFLVLFVRAMERGVGPQFESHWGGIGAGLSGWRMSASLTYLLSAAAFGILFAVFVLQLEPSRGNPLPVVRQPASASESRSGGPAPAPPAANAQDKDQGK